MRPANVANQKLVFISKYRSIIYVAVLFDVLGDKVMMNKRLVPSDSYNCNLLFGWTLMLTNTHFVMCR